MTDAVGDDERALRWIAPVAAQWQGDPPRPTTAVFRQKERSVWIRERLPGDPDDLLHRPPRHSHGPIGLGVGAVRAILKPDGSRHFDVEIDTAGALPPWDHLSEAHANLTGSASHGALKRLLQAVMEDADRNIERRPVLESP